MPGPGRTTEEVRHTGGKIWSVLGVEVHEKGLGVVDLGSTLDETLIHLKS